MQNPLSSKACFKAYEQHHFQRLPFNPDAAMVEDSFGGEESVISLSP